MKKILEELSKNDLTTQHIASKRQVILVTDKSPSETEEVIETLCKIRPTRLFLVKDNVEHKEPTLRSLCHVFGGDRICSDVVTLEGNLKVIANSIRASTLPGVPLDVLLLTQNITQDIKSYIFPLSDRVSFDSDYTQLSEEIISKKGRVLDVSWLRLSAWRQETKAIFDMILAHGGVLPITKITISGNKKHSLYFLYLGWVMSRLPQEVHYEFIPDTLPLTSVSFECKHGSGIIKKNSNFHSRMVVGEKIEERVVNVEDESFHALYSKYILVGESLVNYKAAAKAALQLKQKL